METIKDFFDNIKKKECPKLEPSVCESEYLEDFYENCVRKTLPQKEVVIHWHNLLKRYINDPEAVFFARRYASTKKKGEWDIRRGFLTVFNNIKLVYVDNFFAHYFYAMAINGFKPDYDDFKQFVLNREIPYGYSVVSLEKEHQAYHKGATYPLNKNGWKHSHVFSANQNDYNFNYKEIVQDVFPMGEYGDFKVQGDSNYPYRKVDGSINEDYVKIIKAHFLRVVHPINYFLTPKVNLQSSSMGIKDVGEYPGMIALMKQKLYDLYGNIFTEYQEMIMAPADNPYIGLQYGKDLKKTSSKATEHMVTKTTKKRASSKGSVVSKPRSGKSKFTPEQIAHCINAYLFDKMSFRNIEQTYLGIPKRANGGGFVAKNILNSMDINSSTQKLFYGKSIAEAIAIATEPLKTTLKWMETYLKP